MDSYLKRNTELRNQAWARAKEIMNRAADEGRDLSPEERADLDQTDAALDAYAAEEKRVLGMQAKMQVSDSLRASIEPSFAQARTEQKRERTDAERFADLVRGAVHLDQETGELTSGFESRRTIPVGHGWEQRALQSAGGSAIPTTFADFVTVYERTLNPMLAIARVIQTTSGNPIVFPRVTADVTAGGSVTAEAGGITEGDPTISSITLNAYKVAHTTLWSAELDQDEVIGLDELIAEAIARPIGLGWGTFFTTGDDSAKPNGFITAATNGGTANGTALAQATDTFLNAFDLIDLYYGLAEPYRRNASWVGSNTALAKMHKFRDSTGGLLWAVSLVPGSPDTFLGRPVYENPAMAAVASASKSIAVGDFSKYIIRDVSPMRIDRSTEYKFNTDQIAIRVVTRRDGDLPDTAAIRYLVSANT